MSFWDDRREELRQLLIARPIETFMSWTPIQWTMNTGNPDWLINEYTALKKDKKWLNILKTYEEHPWAKDVERFPETNVTGNTIHHMYHFMVLEQSKKVSLENLNTIFEFGGGFGSASRIAQFVGFQGKYYIYDFPELSIIAKHYHDNECIFRVGLVSDVKDINFDLLVGTWSITESNPILRNKIMRMNYSHALIAFSKEFDGMNNLQYMQNLANHSNGFVLPIPWLPNNFYYLK